METTIIIKEDSLWNRISEFSLDAAEASFPFSRKLAKEEKWTLDFTQKAIEEYKKFVYLCCILPNGASPSEIIDKVWHMHLIYTQNYWEDFCPNILKRKLHHHPSKGGYTEKLKHDDWFNGTLKYYREIFQYEAPEDIWKNHDNINSKKHWIKRLYLSLLLLTPFLFSSCLGQVISVLSPIILTIIAVLGFGYLIFLLQDNGKNNRSTNDGGGGSSCGGNSCSGGGDGGGCGGGCGGCGGCGGG
ncbi:glycine-rich domain-containing protein [Chryseobacterium paludis]|uniref:glycine-rich domain-containing protein n=1 Tax=Chryseobacterium paludis TaxID=2956784 RepID=UPI0021BF379B|nr:hypothetical protein [Chryseobacterium paludis]